MAEKSESKGADPKRPAAVSTITVIEGDKTPYDELMKLPKAQIVRSMSVPENKTRFMMDVDNRTSQGKSIISLMERFRDGDAVSIKTVTDILEALANMAAKIPTPEK